MQKQLTFILSTFLLLWCTFTINIHLSAQSWEQLNDVPFFDDHSNGFGFNGKAYIIKGSPNNNDINQVWEYDPNMDAWTQFDDFPGAGRVVAIGDDWNGKYYFGFGYNPTGFLNDLWEFDPVDGSFTQLPSCPCIGRTHPALIAHNDKIMMGSGSTEDGDIDDWWEYDMTTQVWTQKQNIPGGGRHHPFFFGIDNSVYVGGGHRNNWIKYNLDTEEWTAIDDAPQGRVAGSQLNYNGKGYLIGGDDANHDHVPDFETFMSYNPQSEEWEYLPPLPNGSKWAPSSFIINDALYFFGGYSSNIENDVSFWKFDLSTIECLPPQNLNAINVTDTYAELFWSSNQNADSDTLKWRAVGASTWNEVSNPQSVYALSDLQVCQEYEFLIITVCGEDVTYSDTYTFSTDGCCVNPILTINSISSSTAALEWTDILAAQNYDIRWKPIEESTWSTANINNTLYELTNLTACTDYECQIKTVCTNNQIEFSESIHFLTKGCGSCIDEEFCPVSEYLDGSDGYINEVRINDYVNTTGNDGGYGNYAVPNTEPILIGETFTLTVDPVYDFFELNLTVWLDLNANTIFENNEVVLQEEFVSNEISRNILIPTSATPGLSRMRILYGLNDTAFPCNEEDEFEWGEAEDYCISLTTETTSSHNLTNNKDKVFAYPNPFKNTLQFSSNEQQGKRYQLRFVNVMGKTIQTLENVDLANEIDMSALPVGIYFLMIEDEANFSQTIKLVKQ